MKFVTIDGGGNHSMGGAHCMAPTSACRDLCEDEDRSPAEVWVRMLPRSVGLLAQSLTNLANYDLRRCQFAL